MDDNVTHVQAVNELTSCHNVLLVLIAAFISPLILEAVQLLLFSFNSSVSALVSDLPIMASSHNWNWTQGLSTSTTTKNQQKLMTGDVITKPVDPPSVFLLFSSKTFCISCISSLSWNEKQQINLIRLTQDLPGKALLINFALNNNLPTKYDWKNSDWWTQNHDRS